MNPQDIHAYIKAEEAKFQTSQIQVGDNWYWNFRNHVQLIFHLKNGVFFTGANDWLRAFKNIMEPMLNLSYWTEDIEVKDVSFFIEGDNGRALSFLVKKYHDEVFVRENDLDTVFDEITESDVDYGGVVVQRTQGGIPEVLPLNLIAFCDQTDLMSAPIGFKFNFSPDRLRQMEKSGWGNKDNGATTTVSDLITFAGTTKDAAGVQPGKENESTGKTIEVYITKGTLPKAYLDDSKDFTTYVPQVQVTACYTDKNHKKQGVTLYRKPDDGKSIKFHTSKEVYGRALGRGIGESLLHPQVWTNFLAIHKMQMLQSGAKTPLQTDDPNFKDNNKINDMENLEIMTLTEGHKVDLVPTINPNNIQLYDKSINEWYEQAQLVGSAFDPVLGKEASSGTTFRGQERVVAQGRGLHDRRRGQRAKFIEALYRDWIIPKIVREITKDTQFLAELSVEEMAWVVDQLTTNHVNRRIIDGMMQFKLMTPEERDQAAQVFRQTFLKGGNRKLIKILASDFKGVEIRMGVNIAGKQKDLVNLSDKLLSVFQFVFANPAGFQQAMQIPALSKAFTDILEFSGLDQADFASLLQAPLQPAQLPQPGAPAQGPQAAQPLALNQPAPAQT